MSQPQIQPSGQARVQAASWPSARAGRRIAWPWDMREWVPAEQLLAWLQAEVETLDWQNPKLLAYLRAHPDYRPKLLLSLLSYAYLIGLYAAEDISEQCYSDPTLRQLCQQHPPTATELRVFRRENRGLIRWCLERVLQRALRQCCGLTEELLPAGWRRSVADTALSRLELARYLDRFEHAA